MRAFEYGEIVRPTEDIATFGLRLAVGFVPAGSRLFVLGMHRGNVVVRWGDSRLTLPGRLLQRARP